MNDHSATPSATPEEHPELVRRLEDLSATTTLDVDAAWDNIQARIGADDHGQARAAPRRRALLAVAAALLFLLGATMILNRHDDNDRVRTEDRTTTTDGTTSSTNRRSTSSTTAPASPGNASSGTGAGGTGAGSSGGATGPAPGAPGGVGAPTGQDGSGGVTPNGPGAPPTPAPPSRASAVASASSEQYCCGMTPPAGMYEVELVYAGGVLYFRRVDDVGSTPGPPDGYGSVTTWMPGGIAGYGCLATAGGVYQFPNAVPKSFIWGLAGRDIASIAITIPGQPTTYTGPALPIPGGSGLRAWIISLPLGSVERIEGSDANANVVATITNPPDGFTGSTGC